jgi:hypothetical protein
LLGRKSKGIEAKEIYVKSNRLPLATVTLICSKSEDLKPLEIWASKTSPLGIEAE